jgi:enoyl-CoA hydratase
MKYIELETKDNILIIYINRVEKLNALSSIVIKELDDVFSSYINDNTINSIVITGSGDKSFVAGADISEMEKFTPLDASEYSNKGINLFNRIETYTKPIIAAIDGYALGGGCELAMSCHIRYASEKSLIGLPEVTLGLIPGYGGTQRLRNLVGLGKACELIFSGKYIKAEEALRIGLINKICDDPIEDSLELASKISKNSPLAIKYAIQSITSGLNSNYFDSFDIENNLFSNLFNSYDSKEGINAFLNKRSPKFKGK